MSAARRETCDVAVIGAGMAGMAAALFAAERGLSCLQVGNAGGLLFASGLLDLLAVHPASSGRVWQNPYDALAALARDEPGHPLARIDPFVIREAFEAFVAALGAAGLPYAPLDAANRSVVTSVGTLKTTYAVPRAMIAGVAAYEARVPCLLVGIEGLREFSADQVVGALHHDWPGLRCRPIAFPGAAAHVARALESRDARERTVACVKPLLEGAQAVGFPAVLGIARSTEVVSAFEAALGVPVFEIPTMPTSVPGLRLLAALETAVSVRGVRRHAHAGVRAVSFDPAAECATLALDDGLAGSAGIQVDARAVVLATGRFSGRGLVADRERIREAVLGLPVTQPATRDGWHQRNFLDPAGHPIHRAGLATDRRWRPLDASGRPVWHRLHAIGSILAGQDWIRAKCGSGLAIATAWAAIDEVARELRAAEPARELA
jgi:glycerol-3-phosphate dehydrogenase subunit B